MDKYTREQLDGPLIQEAMPDDMRYVCQHVWNIATEEAMQIDPNKVVIGGRWVACDKGDVERPTMRARYVATETNHQDDTAYFAATPPLESIRVLLSQFVQHAPRNTKFTLSCLDITKACFHAVPTRSFYTRVPTELGVPPNTYGNLKKCCDGTRDAGALWEDTWYSLPLELGFVRGVACPKCFWHPSKKISLVIHVDDFLALGEEDALRWYEHAVGLKFEIGDNCMLGLADNDTKEARVLNRVLRITEHGLGFEADPRHVELLARSLGLDKAAGRVTPGAKTDDDANVTKHHEADAGDLDDADVLVKPLT